MTGAVLPGGKLGTFDPFASHEGSAMVRWMSEGRWFFRVIELGSGHWACRRGSLEYDRHEAFIEAAEHIKDIAARHTPSEVFAHPMDGSVRSIAVLD